jgi:cAMP-dependent protein kinase regulator
LRQGESGDKFYLIADGNLIAEKQENGTPNTKKVFEYQVGDYFGEIALIKNTVRQASIKTVTKCKLMSIDRDSFKRLLGPIEGILMRNMERYKKYMDQ